MPRSSLAIVVPAFNEGSRIEQTLSVFAGMAGEDVEVIFVDDGSTDATSGLLEVFAVSNPQMKVLSFPKNRGKGAAVRAGVAASAGGATVFMDADLSTDVKCLSGLLEALRDHDVVIGSRAIVGTIVESSTWRRAQMGRSFNRLTRTATGLPYRDTQCGFKGFDTGVAKLLFHLSTIDGFAFDAEILMIARSMRLKVVELPVVWKEVDGSHIRPIVDPLRMAWDVMTAKLRSGQRVAVLEVAKEQIQENASISNLAGCSEDIAVLIESGGKYIAFLPFVSMAEASHIQKLGATALGIDFDSIRLREIGRRQAIKLMARRVAKF